MGAHVAGALEQGPSDHLRTGPSRAPDAEHEFLATSRTPAKEGERLDRIVEEFDEGFRQLYRLGPAVTVFGSARFGEGTPQYELGVEIGRELAKAGFAVMTGGGPGMMEAANRGAREAGGVSIGCNIILPFEQTAEPVPGRGGQLPLLLRAQGDAGEVLLRLRLPAGRIRHAGRDVRSGHADSVPEDRAVSADSAGHANSGRTCGSSSGICGTPAPSRRRTSVSAPSSILRRRPFR